MSKPTIGLTEVTVQGRSLRDSCDSRMAESVLNMRTAPAGPDPCIMVCAGNAAAAAKAARTGLRTDGNIAIRPCTRRASVLRRAATKAIVGIIQLSGQSARAPMQPLLFTIVKTHPPLQ